MRCSRPCAEYCLTIILSFDNLGEAAELERGTWDPLIGRGRHPSVTVVLPRLLDQLDALELNATFFVEAINCELNPSAVRAITERGHEVGVHGWRHETWAELTPERERELFARSTAAFASIGVEVGGFRPPGGGLTASTPDLLREFGYRWCSPEAASVPEVGTHGLDWVPFEWECVDAYYLMERFRRLRQQHGESAEPLDASTTALRLRAAVQHSSERPDPGIVILHPFLMLDGGWWTGAIETLRLLSVS